jgi:hypothetical protein
LDPKDQPKNDGGQKRSKPPEEANENIRKSQGDDAMDAENGRKAGNRPAFDRDR